MIWLKNKKEPRPVFCMILTRHSGGTLSSLLIPVLAKLYFPLFCLHPALLQLHSSFTTFKFKGQRLLASFLQTSSPSTWPSPSCTSTWSYLHSLPITICGGVTLCWSWWRSWTRWFSSWGHCSSVWCVWRGTWPWCDPSTMYGKTTHEVDALRHVQHKSYWLLLGVDGW